MSLNIQLFCSISPLSESEADIGNKNTLGILWIQGRRCYTDADIMQSAKQMPNTCNFQRTP